MFTNPMPKDAMPNGNNGREPAPAPAERSANGGVRRPRTWLEKLGLFWLVVLVVLTLGIILVPAFFAALFGGGFTAVGAWLLHRGFRS